jgi:hypothetical protein
LTRAAGIAAAVTAIRSSKYCFVPTDSQVKRSCGGLFAMEASMNSAATIIGGIGLVVATCALAQTVPQSSPPKSAQSREDPGEVICERVKEVGSRLIVKKVCMTRLQWREQKAADRTFTDGVQTQLGALRDGG